MGSFIRFSDVSFWYSKEKEDNFQSAGSHVLSEISLDINKGEFLALVGPNGCGKSTLIRLINGLLLPSMGSVSVDGLDTDKRDHLSAIRRKIGMVFQNPDTQLFASVVEEDVAFGCENLCLPRTEIRERVDWALEQVGMEEYRNYPPHRLSGGQKQKVAIAGVLAMRPECIVLDEPTSMLDPGSKQEVLSAVRDLNTRHNITVIYVTHDMSETIYSSRIMAMARGKIVFEGNPEQLFADKESLRFTGLEAPPVHQLVNSLKEQGIRLPANINSLEELVDFICL
ncbi:energy-coupling factor transporter ATPase [Phosphitispora fastidiosa]|uniref:energy-coupling factor transporter ATPase n=1 Tax=Phosphitispora fastidiosa TaxID=2837202 RepID=UPI001E54F03D|nr:energy-coupling factor transporter ATPase [Phosphitispora fastidiosa]MBU7007433.1 energy-coupling factor transport system ATP-binding protein [Phosphitispora fastidiosa]